LEFNESFSESNSLLERADYNDDKGEIMVAGSDWILIAGAVFRAVIDGIMRTLGTGGIPILFAAGRNAGKKFANAVLEEGTPIEELPRWLRTFFTWGGWGRVGTRVDMVKKEAAVEILNCATARGIRSKVPSCHFIRGYIAGVGEVLFNSPTECSETKCMSKGDNCCLFRVQVKTD
jgi:predicted hydrocarbon binding protein